MTKRGRKKKDEYYKTKKVDNVVLNDTFIIYLPITKDEINEMADTHASEQSIIIQKPSTLIGYYNYKNTHFSEFKPVKTEAGHTRKQINHASKPVFKTETEERYILNIVPEEIHCSTMYKSNINCWWCCHAFDTPPVFMPTHLNDDKYRVKGIFCSFECCYSYVLSLNGRQLNTTKYLLNYYFRDVTKLKGSIDDHIKKAPKRETLQMFGGPLSIEKFRDSNIQTTLYPYPQVYTPDQVKVSKSSPAPVEIKTVSLPRQRKSTNKIITNNLNKILRII